MGQNKPLSAVDFRTEILTRTRSRRDGYNLATFACSLY